MSLRSRAGACDERTLLAAVAARDREALKQLYYLYHRRLSRFLARVTRSPGSLRKSSTTR